MKRRKEDKEQHQSKRGMAVGTFVVAPEGVCKLICHACGCTDEMCGQSFTPLPTFPRHTHTQTHARMHTHMHTHTYTHKHTPQCLQIQLLKLPSKPCPETRKTLVLTEQCQVICPLLKVLVSVLDPALPHGDRKLRGLDIAIPLRGRDLMKLDLHLPLHPSHTSV